MAVSVFPDFFTMLHNQGRPACCIVPAYMVVSANQSLLLSKCLKVDIEMMTFHLTGLCWHLMPS